MELKATLELDNGLELEIIADGRGVQVNIIGQLGMANRINLEAFNEYSESKQGKIGVDLCIYDSKDWAGKPTQVVTIWQEEPEEEIDPANTPGEASSFAGFLQDGIAHTILNQLREANCSGACDPVLNISDRLFSAKVGDKYISGKYDENFQIDLGSIEWNT